jgi:hypothetical protein
MEPAGQDLGAPLVPEINGSLARDRFDSDCVLGTQFESSQPHHPHFVHIVLQSFFLRIVQQDTDAGQKIRSPSTLN